MPTHFLDSRDVTELFGVTRRTLYGWRAKGFGPRSQRIGGKLLYDRADVAEWLTANQVETGRGGL